MKDIANHVCCVMKEAFITRQTSEVCQHMTDDSDCNLTIPIFSYLPISKCKNKNSLASRPNQVVRQHVSLFQKLIDKCLPVTVLIVMDKEQTGNVKVEYERCINFQISHGTRQGSVLTPALWSV